MKDQSILIWSMLFGAIGLGFFVYGTRQRVIVPFVIGVSLFIFPYFVSNLYLLIVTGVVLVAVPYYVRF
jgi:predicted membrane protein